MYAGFIFSFKCDRSVLEMESIWNIKGPFEWKGFDSEIYGIYIVSRPPHHETNLRVIGEPPEYELEISFIAEGDKVEAVKSELFSTIFESLLPAVGARDIQKVLTQGKPVKFSFEIGEQEKHTIEFSHRKFWRNLNFLVDGRCIPINDLPHFSARAKHAVSVPVGENEKHEVRIEITRPRFLAALRRGWKYKVLIDGKDFKTFED